jgi:hypothetical protein
MGDIALDHRTARVGLGRDDVILGDREVEPVLRALVVLHADLGLLVGEGVARAHVPHVAVLALRGLEGIREQAAEGRGHHLRIGAHVVEAGEVVEGTVGAGDDQARPVDVAQVRRRSEAEGDRGGDVLAGDRVVGQHHQAVEAVGHVEGPGDGGLDEHVVGVVDVPVDAQEGGVLEAVGGGLELVAVAPAGFVAHAVTQAGGGVLGDVPAQGDAVELIVDQRSHGGAAPRLVVAVVQGHTVGGGAATDGQVDRRAADVLPVEVGPLDPQDVRVGYGGGGAVHVDGGGLAVEDLDAGGVAPHLVHGQAAVETHVFSHVGVHLQAQPAGVHDVVGVVVAGIVGVRQQELLELGDLFGRHAAEGLLQLVPGQVVREVQVVRVVLGDEVVDLADLLGRHAGGAHVEHGVDHQALQLRSVEVLGDGGVDGVGLDPEVAGEVDPVQSGLALVLHDPLLEILELFLQLLDVFRGHFLGLVGVGASAQAQGDDGEQGGESAHG